MTPIINKTTAKISKRDEFVLKFFMNKKSIKPGQYTDDLLYFFEEYNDAMRNGEYFEQAFMGLYGITYNKNLTGADGHKIINGETIIYEAKKEMKSKDLKLDGKSAWSIHCYETLVMKQNDPNFYLLQFGFKNNCLVYALKIKMDNTSILKGKTPHKHSKLLANWKDFKDAEEIYPLFLNRELIKKWAGADFKNWLLSLKETDPSVFGVDIRNIVGLEQEIPEVYYHKDKYTNIVNSTPKFPANGITCLALPETLWEETLAELKNSGLGQRKTLQLDGGVLYLQRFDDCVGIRSSIDRLKSYRAVSLI